MFATLLISQIRWNGGSFSPTLGHSYKWKDADGDPTSGRMQKALQVEGCRWRSFCSQELHDDGERGR
jgi:hypothetical protein